MVLTPLCVSAILLSFGLKAQNDEGAKSVYINPWSVYLDLGINSFSTSGIPMSRNQVNYNVLHPDAPSSYLQESRIAGLVYEFGIKYKFKNDSKIGLSINVFKDNDEYLYNLDQSNGVEAILQDSLQVLSIRNMQSYVNPGLSYEHSVLSSQDGRHLFYAGIAIGMAINLTPDRSEFDYFEEENFVIADSIAGNAWRVTHTDFKNGFFIAPSLNYNWRVFDHHYLRFTVSQRLQWHATEQELKILGQNSGGSSSPEPYSLRAIQFKIGYSF